MLETLELDSTHHSHIHKPTLASHDSGSECSLDHFLEVYWLVEEEFQFAKHVDSEPWQEALVGPS